MADVLIETVNSNPYDSVVADTSTKISNMDEQIQMVTNEISKLEKTNPSSPTLSQLRDRLASLQREKQDLTQTNASAKSLSQSFNQWQQNVNTLKWIYDIKQQELEKAKAEDERTYRQMIEETRRDNQNYINALWNANSSENAIINANAWAVWASTQSTAEARARNYLNNAQAQAEAANNARATINNLEQARMNSNQWYTQLSQSNADNYLRQQVLADMEAAENEKTRQAQYWSSWWWSRWTSSRWTSNIFDPYSLINKNKNNNNNNNNDTDTDTNTDTNTNTDTDENWYPSLSKILADFDKQWTSPIYDAVKKLNPNITENEFRNHLIQYQRESAKEKRNTLNDDFNKWNISLEDYWKWISELNQQEKDLKKTEKDSKKKQQQLDYYKNLYLKAVNNNDGFRAQVYLKQYNDILNS